MVEKAQHLVKCHNSFVIMQKVPFLLKLFIDSWENACRECQTLLEVAILLRLGSGISRFSDEILNITAGSISSISCKNYSDKPTHLFFLHRINQIPFSLLLSIQVFKSLQKLCFCLSHIDVKNLPTNIWSFIFLSLATPCELLSTFHSQSSYTSVPVIVYHLNAFCHPLMSEELWICIIQKRKRTFQHLEFICLPYPSRKQRELAP